MHAFILLAIYPASSSIGKSDQKSGEQLIPGKGESSQVPKKCDRCCEN